MDRLLFRVPEAAEALGLKTVTLRRMIADGRVPVVRPTGGRAVRIRVEDVELLSRLGPQVQRDVKRRRPSDRRVAKRGAR